MAALVDVDELYNRMGRFGVYQKRQLTVAMLSILSCSIPMFSIVFLGFKPNVQCDRFEFNDTETNLNGNNSVTYEYGECSVIAKTNISGLEVTHERECTSGWSYNEDGEYDRKRSIVSEWDLVCDKSSLTEFAQTFIIAGQGIGAIVATSLSDRFGRRTLAVICHIGICLSGFVTALVPNYMLFAVMRTLTGAFQQGTSLTSWILVLESYPTEIRGYMDVLALASWTTGIVVMTPIAYIFQFTSWRYFQIGVACLSVWSLFQWWLMDESLRWCIANGRLEEAKRLLEKACRQNNTSFKHVIEGTGFREFEMRIIAAQDKKDRNEDMPLKEEDVKDELNKDTVPQIRKYTCLDLLRSKRLLFTSMILWFAWITNTLTYYGIMMMSSSLAGNRFLNFFLGAIVEYPAALMEAVMIYRFGRKPAMIVFHVICGVSLIIASVLTANTGGNAAMILSSTVFTLIGKFAITGSYSILFLYTPELYPTNMRNVGIGLSSTSARFGSILAPFSRTLAEVALWAPGLIFGTMCMLLCVAMLWVPETNRYELPQTVEETEQWYKENRFRLPCSSRQRQAPHSAGARQICVFPTTS